MKKESDRIVDLLKQGHTLANRGTGWFLAAPRGPYKKVMASKISDKVINFMENEGVIDISIHYISLIATLK